MCFAVRLRRELLAVTLSVAEPAGDFNDHLEILLHIEEWHPPIQLLALYAGNEPLRRIDILHGPSQPVLLAFNKHGSGLSRFPGGVPV
jgi:hypothetical protein